MIHLIAGPVLLSLVTILPFAQVPPVASKDDGKFNELADRYREILRNRPQRGTAFDQWYRHYLDAGRLDELASLAEGEARRNSDDFAAQMIAGLVYERRGQEDQAIHSYSQAEKLAADNYLPAYLRGTLLAQRSRFTEATAALARAIELEPPRAELLEIYKRLGRLYLRQGKMREATDTWSQVAEKFPDDRAALEELAELLADEEQFEEAMRRWEQVAKLSKDDLYRQLLARVEIAQLRARMGNSKDAIALLDQTLDEVDPDNWLARDIERRIEEIFQQIQDPAGLVGYYENRLQRRPGDLGSIVRLAAALARNGKTPDALNRYRSAAKLAPGRRDVRESLIRELVRAGQFPEAIAECEELANRNPGATDLLRMLGQLHLDAASPANRRDAELQAIETWKRIAAVRPNDPTLAVQVAEACRHAALLPPRAAASDSETSPLLATAEDFYCEAIRRAPNLPEYHEYLGEFLHRLGRKDEAIAALAKLAAPPGDTAENWHRLADIYARFEYFDDAVAAGEKSLELAPNQFEYRATQVQWLVKTQDFDAAMQQLAHLDRLADDPALEEKSLQRRIEVVVAASRTDEEVKRLQAALESGSGTMKDHWTLGLLLAQKHRFTEASKSLELAMRLAPGDVRLVKARAAILEQAGNMAGAVDQFRKLVELEPRSRSAHLEKIARMELELGRGARAREAVDALIQASPSNLAGYKLRAEIAFRLGDPAAGLDALRQAVRIAPRELDVRLQLARALGEQRKLDEALEHYWRAFETVEHLSDKLAIVSAVTEISSAVGRVDRVLDHLRELRRRRDDTKGMSLCLVEALRRSGDSAGARRELMGLLAARRDDLDVLSQLVLLAENTKDWATAVTYQQQIVALVPDRANLEMLAKLYTLKGDEAEASKIWKRLVTDTEDTTAWLAAVDRQLQRGNLAEALQLAEMGLAKQPDDWRFMFRAALAQLGLGHTQEAETFFTGILNQPRDPKYDAPSASSSAQSAASAQNPWNVTSQGLLLTGAAGQLRLRLLEFNDVVIARSAFVRFYSLQTLGPAGAAAMGGGMGMGMGTSGRVTSTPGYQAPPGSFSQTQLQQIQVMQSRRQQELQYRQQLAALQTALAQLQSQGAQQQQIQAIQTQIQSYQQAINQAMQSGPFAASLPAEQRTAKIESALAMFVSEQRVGRTDQWSRATLASGRSNPEFNRLFLLAHLGSGRVEETQRAISQVAEFLPDDPLPHVARICVLETQPLDQSGAKPPTAEEIETLGRSVEWLAARKPQIQADLTYAHGYLLLRAGRTDEAARLIHAVIDAAQQPTDLGLLPDLVPRLGEPALVQKLFARLAELAGRSNSPATGQYLQFALTNNFLFATDDEYVEALLQAFERYFEMANSSGPPGAGWPALAAPGRSPVGRQTLAPVWASRRLAPDVVALLEQVFTIMKSSNKVTELRARLERRAAGSDAATRQAYFVAAACVDWWNSQPDAAIRTLEKLSGEPTGDPSVSLALAQAYFDSKDPLKALDRLNQVPITSGILLADVDELRTQIVRQLYVAGDRELILRGLMVELERPSGEPQLGLFFGSPDTQTGTTQSSARTQPRGASAPVSRSTTVRKSAGSASNLAALSQAGFVSRGAPAPMPAQSQGSAGTPEFRVQLPLPALLEYAKSEQKLGDLIQRAEAQRERWPNHSQLIALVALARFADGDVTRAAEAAGRWASDVSKRQDQFGNPEAWLVVSACLQAAETRPLGRQIVQHVLQISIERGWNAVQQSVVADWTAACVTDGDVAAAERILADWADAVEQAAVVSTSGNARRTARPPQPQPGETPPAGQFASGAIAAATALASVAEKLPPALLPGTVRLISTRVRADIDKAYDAQRIVRPIRDAVKAALPEMSEPARRQTLDDLLAMLFPYGADKNAGLYVPAGGDARGLAGILAQAVIDLAKSTGDLERLRADWDKHPLADKSRTLVALRAAAAESIGDKKAADKLLAELGGQQKIWSFDANSVVLVPATAPKRSYGPEQALGPPDTPNPGDYPTAWASSTSDGSDEWLLLQFPQPVVPANIKIHENCAPGAVVKVTAFKQDGTEVDAWSGTDPTPVGQPSGVSVIPLSVNFATNRVRLTIDSRRVHGYNEVDSVGLVDSSGNLQWASAAAASSVYGQASPSQPVMIASGMGMSSVQPQPRPSWGIEQVLGPPDTPEAGDRPTAWTSNSPDGQDEWLILEYGNAVVPKSIKVYETCGPGAVTKVSVMNPDGTEVEAWSGTDPTPRGVPRGVSVIPLRVDFEVKRVKLHIASKEVPGWNEFDAVGLVDSSGKTQWATSATASSIYGQGTPVATTMVATSTTSQQTAALQQLQQQAVEFKRSAERKQVELEEQIRQLKEDVARLRDQLKDKSGEQKP